MAKIDLKDKFIPLKFCGQYSVSVSPSRTLALDEDGEERMPKSFSFKAVVDTLGNAYILPDHIGELGYTVADIVAAALGDKNELEHLERCKEAMQKEYFNLYMLTPRWNHTLWKQAKSFVIEEFNEMKAARGEAQNAIDELPESTTNYDELSIKEASAIAKTAKISKNKA